MKIWRVLPYTGCSALVEHSDEKCCPSCRSVCVNDNGTINEAGIVDYLRNIFSLPVNYR